MAQEVGAEEGTSSYRIYKHSLGDWEWRVGGRGKSQRVWTFLSLLNALHKYASQKLDHGGSFLLCADKIPW